MCKDLTNKKESLKLNTHKGPKLKKLSWIYSCCDNHQKNWSTIVDVLT